MTYSSSAGRRVRDAMHLEHPLQVVGVPNAYVAMMAEDLGFRALYLSGAGVSNFSFGLPDLGLTTLEQVLEETKRMVQATPLPLIVDADTGFEDPRITTRAFEQAGAAGIHIEDQVERKRCGHLEGKELISKEEMARKIQSAVEEKLDMDFLIIARTDAAAVEGLDAAIDRAIAYRDAGADMIFAEALQSKEEYHHFMEKVGIPILANCTEFGKTPLLNQREWIASGVTMVLYPLTIARVMNQAGWNALKTLREEGTQKNFIDQMQTRQELYDILEYETFEKEVLKH